MLFLFIFDASDPSYNLARRQFELHHPALTKWLGFGAFFFFFFNRQLETFFKECGFFGRKYNLVLDILKNLWALRTVFNCQPPGRQKLLGELTYFRWWCLVLWED